MYTKHLKDGCQENGAGLFSMVPVTGEGAIGTTETQEVPSEQEELLYCAGGRDWNRLPRKAVRFLFLEILKKCINVILCTSSSLTCFRRGVG